MSESENDRGISAIGLVPDTNALMHFTRVDQQDWPLLLSSSVTILLTSQLLGELDKHRRTHPDARLRQRARDLIEWIDQFVEGATESHGVKVELWVSEPMTFDTDLDRNHPDDRIVATVAHISQSGRFTPVVFSDDTNLRAKLKARGMRFVRPPAETELQSEMDPTALDLKKARAELQALKARAPKLELAFSRHGRVREVALPALPKLPSLDEARALFPEFGQDQSGYMTRDGVQLRGLRINWSVLQQFGRQYDDYLEKYKAFLSEAAKHDDTRRRVVAVPLRLDNKGTVVANEVRARLEVDSGALILPRSSYAHPLQSPMPPQVPHSLSHILNLDSLPRRGPPFIDYADPYADQSLRAQVAPDQRSVQWNRARVAHADGVDLDDLRLLIDADRLGGAVQLRALLIADELPEEQETTLVLKIGL